MVEAADAVFVQFMKNGRKAPSMEAKKLRGTMARQIVDLKLKRREAVRQLRVGNYRYNPEQSQAKLWVFEEGEQE